MSNLLELEQQFSTAVRRRRLGDRVPGFWPSLLITYFSIPFLVADFLFIPLLGQFIPAICIGLVLYLIYLKRSVKFPVAIALGTVLGILTLVAVSTAYPTLANRITYVLMGLTMAVTIALMLLLGALVYYHFYEGEEEKF
jgi:hypothetical protein